MRCSNTLIPVAENVSPYGSKIAHKIGEKKDCIKIFVHWSETTRR